MKSHARTYFLRLPHVAAALLLMLVTSGCDEDTLVTPEVEDPLFTTYVSIGNSITAGLQSAGINRDTQLESYAVQLAGAMETEFNVPLLEMPGCPPPLISALPPQRLGGPEAEPCALRVDPIAPTIHNVAVPGAEMLDVLSNSAPESNPSGLTTLLLGGRTQLEAAADADPTFVSAWIGNNDILGAALRGLASPDEEITPLTDFKTRYNRMLDSLQAMGVQGGILVGIADITLIPHFSPGAAYWQAEQRGVFQAVLEEDAANFDVADSCGPSAAGGVGETTLVPFGYAFGVLIARARAGMSVVLDCATDEAVLSQGEIGQVAQAVAAYNAFIKTRADQLGWAYYSVNPLFDELKQQEQIPMFPQLASPELFGPYFSLDGIHPSALAHARLAQEIAGTINNTYGTELAVVEAQ